MEAIIFGFVSYFGFTSAEYIHDKIREPKPESEVCEADEEYIKRSKEILSVTLLEN